MRDNRSSRTAAWVAASRTGFGLPPGTKLCDDPYGILFSGFPTTGVGGTLTRLLGSTLIHESQVRRLAFWMQLRTRYLDDVLLAFVRGGGRQIVILGAGFDCRAIRFRAELGDTTVFEVDHPATQAFKKDVLSKGAIPPSPSKFIKLDFEQQPMSTLPSLLVEAGHNPERATLTIWEGVTMYLTEPAIEASVAAVREYSGPGSQLAFTYFDLAQHRNPDWSTRIMMNALRRAGEPWRFGWEPEKLGAWLLPRGFDLRDDVTEQSLANRHFPPKIAQRYKLPGRHIALTVRAE